MSHDFYVDPEGDLVIEAIVRAQSVKRWHMIDTTRSQSIAEHSATVALLAYHIAMGAPAAYFGSPAGIALVGLLHDLPESFTGDLPTHTKRAISGIDELEDQLMPRELTYIMGNNVKALIKMCDLAEGIRFIRVHGVDNTAKWARSGLTQKLAASIVSIYDVWPRDVYEHVTNKIDHYINRT